MPKGLDRLEVERGIMEEVKIDADQGYRENSTKFI